MKKLLTSLIVEPLVLLLLFCIVLPMLMIVACIVILIGIAVITYDGIKQYLRRR